jgi:hypothetical protein
VRVREGSTRCTARKGKGSPSVWRSDGCPSGRPDAAHDRHAVRQGGGFKAPRDAWRPREGARGAAGGVGADA